MKSEKISVKTARDGEQVSWEGAYQVPETLAEATAQYGEAVVFGSFLSQLVTNVQNIARSALREGKDVAAATAAYVIGQKRERAPADPTAAILANFGKMDADARKALIAQLRASLSQ